MHRMGSVELRPNAFSAVRSHSPLVFQFQLGPGLLRGRRVTRPVRAAGGFRLHALCRLLLQRQLRITHCNICWTAVRGRELPFSAGVILEERPEMLRRIDKFDLVTHGKDHIEECSCHVSGKQCQKLACDGSFAMFCNIGNASNGQWPIAQELFEPHMHHGVADTVRTGRYSTCDDTNTVRLGVADDTGSDQPLPKLSAKSCS